MEDLKMTPDDMTQDALVRAFKALFCFSLGYLLGTILWLGLAS